MNKPVLAHIVERLAKQGFDEVIITTNYKVEQIREQMGDGSKWGIKIKIVHEDKPLGTAGSVKNALHHLNETFAVVQGDSISDIDIGALYKKHKKMGGLVTICLREVDDVSHFGIAEIKGDEIVRFKEKPKPDETFSNLANAGIYIIEPHVLDMIPLEFYDFSKNLFPKMLEEKKKICGVISNDFWRDVGTPRDYLEATCYFLKHKNCIGEGSKVKDSDIRESCVGRNCVITGASVMGSVVLDGTKIDKGSKLKSCIVGYNCKIGKNVDIWPGAVIGDDVTLKDGAIIKSSSRIGPRVEMREDEVVNGVVAPKDLETSE